VLAPWPGLTQPNLTLAWPDLTPTCLTWIGLAPLPPRSITLCSHSPMALVARSILPLSLYFQEYEMWEPCIATVLIPMKIYTSNVSRHKHLLLSTSKGAILATLQWWKWLAQSMSYQVATTSSDSPIPVRPVCQPPFCPLFFPPSLHHLHLMFSTPLSLIPSCRSWTGLPISIHVSR